MSLKLKTFYPSKTGGFVLVKVRKSSTLYTGVREYLEVRHFANEGVAKAFLTHINKGILSVPQEARGSIVCKGTEWRVAKNCGLLRCLERELSPIRPDLIEEIKEVLRVHYSAA